MVLVYLNLVLYSSYLIMITLVFNVSNLFVYICVNISIKSDKQFIYLFVYLIKEDYSL